MTELLGLIGEVLLYVGGMALAAYFVFSIFVSPTENRSKSAQQEAQEAGRRFFERREKERRDRRVKNLGPPGGRERRAGPRRKNDNR